MYTLWYGQFISNHISRLNRQKNSNENNSTLNSMATKIIHRIIYYLTTTIIQLKSQQLNDIHSSLIGMINIRFQQHNYKQTIIHFINPTNLNMQQNVYHSAVAHLNHFFDVGSFQKYFIHSKDNFAELSTIIKECNLSDLHCRFNIWRLCLGVVSVDANEEKKRNEIAEQRKKYQQKKDQAYKSFNKKSPIKQPVKRNPLLMMSSPKPQQNKQIESDQFLKQQIHKDVERTYQEMKFFQDKAILKLLNLILFVWCRRNPQVSYKQGMNELLASVVVCYFKEAEFKSKEEKPQFIDEKVWQSHLFFNSAEHAESDIFAVFQKIIDIQGDMYKTEADLTLKTKVNPNSKNNTPILQRIIQIKDHKLKHMDLELFRILKLQDVQTKSFMLRWIRCMHTRQFDLDNSFVIWDSIFLEFLESENSRKNKQFEFIDAMCLAMFMYMRSIVFTKQTAGQILQVYQKYPALKRGAYLDQLITLAWTICEELRNQSHNTQASQSNWFEESQKLKALHFMQRKQQRKPSQPPVEVKPVQVVKKPQASQKQLRQTPKNPEIHKKNSQPTPIHKAKQNQSESSIGSHDHKPKTEQNDSTQKIKEITTDKVKENASSHKSTPGIDKQAKKQTIKIKSAQEVIKQQKHENGHSSAKVPDNISITLSSVEINQLLQNLNESLPKIRDIDAQSLIRRSIKKIEAKVKHVKQQLH